MHRTTGDSFGTDPIGGQSIFRAEDPGAAFDATQADFSWANALQEEIANIILGFGGTLNSSSETVQQMNQAYARISGAIDAEAFSRNANDRILSGVLVRDEMNAVNTDLGEATVLASMLKQSRGHIDGFKVSKTGTTDIQVDPGACEALGYDAFIVLAAAMTKDLSATWVAGDGNGGRATGVSLTDPSWWHVFVIKHTDGTVDAGFDIALDGSNLLTGSSYTYARRVGSIYYVSAAIRNFYHLIETNTFLWATPVLDEVATSVAVSPTVTTLQLLESCPSGFESEVMMTASVGNASGFDLRIWDGPMGSASIPSGAAAFTGSPSNAHIWEITLFTDVLRRVYCSEISSGTPSTLSLFCRAYRDRRIVA